MILLQECIEALGNGVLQLSPNGSEALTKQFETAVPIYRGGSKIDWNKISNHRIIDAETQIIPSLEELMHRPIDIDVYVFWNDASLPVIKTDLKLILTQFEHVVCVGFETWIYNPEQRYVIECHDFDKIVVGVL